MMKLLVESVRESTKHLEQYQKEEKRCFSRKTVCRKKLRKKKCRVTLGDVFKEKINI